jgi:hypothetical protein
LPWPIAPGTHSVQDRYLSATRRIFKSYEDIASTAASTVSITGRAGWIVASSTAVLICTRSVAPDTSTRPLGLITAFQRTKFSDKNINIEIILNFAYLDPA